MEEAVLRELVRIAMDKLSSSKEDAKKVLTEKTAAGLPHKTLLKKLEMLEQKIKNVGEHPEKLYKNRDVYQFDLIDWKRIALEVFPNHSGFDGDFLRRWWKCHLDPSFQRGDMNIKEIDLLKKLTKDCNPENGIDFEAIATQISKELKLLKRHKFQLVQYYQKKLNLNNRKFGWTKVMTKILYFIVSKLNPVLEDVWPVMR